MNQHREVHTMYWVTHPAFDLPWRKVEEGEKTMHLFFSQVLENITKNVQKDPNAVLILIRSPSLKWAIKRGKITKEDVKKMEEIEASFEKFSKRLLKDRFVSFSDTKASTERAATFVSLVLKKRGLIVLPKTKMIGAGSYLTACSKYYPLSFFLEKHPFGKRLLLKVRKEFDKLSDLKNSSESVSRLFRSRDKKIYKYFRNPESINIAVPSNTKRAGFMPRTIK